MCFRGCRIRLRRPSVGRSPFGYSCPPNWTANLQGWTLSSDMPTRTMIRCMRTTASTSPPSLHGNPWRRRMTSRLGDCWYPRRHLLVGQERTSRWMSMEEPQLLRGARLGPPRVALLEEESGSRKAALTPGDVGVVVAAGLFVLASVAYRRCPLGPLADEIAQKVSEAASTEAATTNKLDRWIARTFSSQHSKRRRWGISD